MGAGDDSPVDRLAQFRAMVKTQESDQDTESRGSSEDGGDESSGVDPDDLVSLCEWDCTCVSCVNYQGVRNQRAHRREQYLVKTQVFRGSSSAETSSSADSDTDLCTGDEGQGDLQSTTGCESPAVNCLQPAPLLHVPVTVNGQTISALVDTACTYSVVAASQVRGMVEPLARPMSLVGLNGEMAVPRGQVKLRLAIGLIELEGFFLVLADNQIRYPMILGIDFFTKHSVFIDLNRQHLAGQTQEGAWDVYLGDQPHTYIRRAAVVVAKNVSVATGETLQVPVCLAGCSFMGGDDWTELYFEPVAQPQGVTASAGIMDIKGGVATVLVTRAAEGAATNFSLTAGTVLGHVSTIVDMMVIDGEEQDAEMSRVDLSYLSPEQQEQVYGLFRQHETVASKGDTDIGLAGVTKHRIELYDDTPIRQHPRRFPQPVVEEIEKQCEELMSMDVIEHSKSPWSSPMVPIRKKDGSLRLCIDYRRLNQVTKPDRHPMPDLPGMVYSMHGSRFFSTLDLVKGYYQVGLEEGSREVTAFSTTRNHYHFKRLAFGLKNAPSAFQREMQVILSGFDSRNVMVFIDDIMVVSPTFQEHLELVGKVLATLARYGVKIKLSKCCWFKSEVTFLGHLVGVDGIRKSPKYAADVKDFPKPVTVKNLRSFNGLINFQRKFVPDCSRLSAPLNAWLKYPDRTKLKWTDEMDQSFQKLKDLIAEDILLAYPDYSSGAELMELSTDASKQGAGACLTQVQDGVTRVIAYGSTTFNKAQSGYGAIELELAGIRWAVGAFRSFLFGVPFVLYTDHIPLTHMPNISKNSGRVMRTWAELGHYDFTIKYKPGKHNQVADTLSRLHQEEEDVEGDHSQLPTLPEGLQVLIQVPGGGDSMVASLYEVLKSKPPRDGVKLALPQTVQALREKLSNHLVLKPELYSDADKHQRAFRRLSRLQGQVPPLEFLEAFSRLFELQVWVHFGLSQPMVFSHGSNVPCTESHRRVHLQLVSGVHYNPLIETPAYAPSFIFPEIEAVTESDSEGDSDIKVMVAEEKFDELEGLGELFEVSLRAQHPEAWHLSCGHKPSAVHTSISVGSKSFCAILDTGAQVSLISDEALRQLEEEATEIPESFKLRSLASDKVETHGSVSFAWKLAGFPASSSVPFGRVSDGVLSACALIGANILRELGVIFDFGKEQITFGEEGERRHAIFSSAFSGHEVNTLTTAACRQVQAGDIIDSLEVLGVSMDQMEKSQGSDEVLRQLRRKVVDHRPASKWRTKGLLEFKRHFNWLKCQEGLLTYERPGGDSVPVVPFSLLVDVVVKLHRESSHIGRNKMVETIRQVLWHPRMYNVVRDVCRSCLVCQEYKVQAQVVAPPTSKVATTRPFELVSMDCVNLERTGRGHHACLVAVDHHTKWAAVMPLKDKRAATISRIFECNMLPFFPRRPERILADNGPEFVGDIFTSMLARHSIRLSHSTPNMPSCNGAVERMNRTLLQMLRLSNSDRPWDEHLAHVVLAYNNTVHASIGMTPVEAIMTKKHAIKGELIKAVAVKEQWREGHPKFASFKVGDAVMVKETLQGHRVGNKFAKRFRGPYKIQAVNSNGVSYVIEGDDGKRRVHHRQLVAFRQPPDYLKGYPDFRVQMSEAGEGGLREKPPLEYETVNESDSQIVAKSPTSSSLKTSSVGPLGGTGVSGASPAVCKVRKFRLSGSAPAWPPKGDQKTSRIHPVASAGNASGSMVKSGQPASNSLSTVESERLITALSTVSRILDDRGTYIIEAPEAAEGHLGRSRSWDCWDQPRVARCISVTGNSSTFSVDPSESLLTVCRRVARQHQNCTTGVSMSEPEDSTIGETTISPTGVPERTSYLANGEAATARLLGHPVPASAYRLYHSTPHLAGDSSHQDRTEPVLAEARMGDAALGNPGENTPTGRVQAGYGLRSRGPVSDYPNVMPRAI